MLGKNPSLEGRGGEGRGRERGGEGRGGEGRGQEGRGGEGEGRGGEGRGQEGRGGEGRGEGRGGEGRGEVKLKMVSLESQVSHTSEKSTPAAERLISPALVCERGSQHSTEPCREDTGGIRAAGQ